MQTKQIICINWGTKYGAPFINRLYGMVARHVTPPFTFTCFTDTRDGVRPEVLCEDLPPIDYEIPKVKSGIWPKSRLWGPKLGSLSGPVLFLDLDLVVTGSLDAFFEVGKPSDTILARNQSTPLEKLGQTSVFRFEVGALQPLQEKFKQDPRGIAEEYRYEQRFVTRNAPGGVDFFPRTWVRHYRLNCRWPFPLNYALTPRLPRDARIVIFPGGIHPQHAIEGRYGNTYKTGSALEHIRGLTDPDRPDKGRPIRYLRHYMKPAPWVAEHWQA
ncbi:glycosyl transferase [Salipiger sp. IMCC34102]|uniref:glycosyl transferase n=1 Tax=Salipiger sp. IMCC34102 TaxID=2510647 RepID=UPI00101C5C48|nr:glycosyl transferase [Salipiger sp. IMCC34102]RYH03082.1 glycosyl transferase [Salipiger sp. IMCC34102]